MVKIETCEMINCEICKKDMHRDYQKYKNNQRERYDFKLPSFSFPSSSSFCAAALRAATAAPLALEDTGRPGSREDD